MDGRSGRRRRHGGGPGTGPAAADTGAALGNAAAVTNGELLIKLSALDDCNYSGDVYLLAPDGQNPPRVTGIAHPTWDGRFRPDEKRIAATDDDVVANGPRSPRCAGGGTWPDGRFEEAALVTGGPTTWRSSRLPRFPPAA